MATRPTTYEEATYASPWSLIRYPHRRRIDTAIELAAAARPRVVVDYGAGGGELIASLLSDARANTVEVAVAYDPMEAISGRLQARLGEDPRVIVADDVERISVQLGGRAPDAILCMGVLEHLPLRERLGFYRFCLERLSPGGRVVIDVPVEVGPALLIKQFGRRVLKRRDREYSPRELARAVVGVKTVDPARFSDDAEADFIFTHKGFDHRVFRREVEQFQKLRETVTTPVRWLPSWLCNQEIMYVCEPAAVDGPS